jgi:sulfotransferase family protein
MAIEVIGAGFGRTGTMSLKVALEELGFGPCYHMIELFGHPEHVELWEAASQGKPVDWEELFSGYRATTDWPACSFYEELTERYPDAKVILTVRDPDRWYESTYNTIYGMRRMLSSPIFRLAAPFRPGLRRATQMNDRLIWEDTFGGSLEDRERAIEVFERHNEEVKERVPAEKLLVYEVKEGWEPLCEFLGVEVPKDKPFPHLNDTDTFRTMIRRRLALALTVPVVAVSLAGLVLLRLRRRHRR